MKQILTVFLCLFFSLAHSAMAAPLKLVATTASMKMLAYEIGGTRVAVSSLAPADRDPHHLQAKPSMIRALRSADILISVGAGLEVGWLPAAIERASNPAIQVGQTGHFVATDQLELLDVNPLADRSQGDVHPEGNPHVQLDPDRMISIAKALSARLAILDPEGADDYRRNTEALVGRLQQHILRWQQYVLNPAVVLYHQEGRYLLHRFGLQPLGYIEVLPGVPATARHLNALRETIEALTGQNKSAAGLILRSPYQPARPCESLAQGLSRAGTAWKVQALPNEPFEAGGEGRLSEQPTLEDYIQLIDQWLEALKQ
jgi:zinc/manganese transport system substrate-binding protein